MEWAQSKELLEPTIENNNKDDDSNDDGDDGSEGSGKFNKVAKMAAKSSDVDDDYSNDDGNDGSDGSGKFIDGGGEYIPSGKRLYYPDDDAFLGDIFDDDYVEKHFSSIPDEPACDRNRNRIMGGPQPPSKKQVPLVQDVIQADGAHMSSGKYTLFSAYATSTNGAMVSLGFAILFGNEDTSNGIKFWTEWGTTASNDAEGGLVGAVCTAIR